MDVAHLILEYVRVLLSAPPVIAVVVGSAIIGYRAQIGRLMDRIKRAKGWGVEIDATQQERADATITAKDEPPPVPTSDVSLPQGIPLTPEQTEQIVHLIQSERANAALWEYRYLNLFLVRSTQIILDWFYELQRPVGIREFDTIWNPLIPDVNQRNTILVVLENQHLIQRTGDLIQITPKGREYRHWRGALPPLLTA